MAGCAQRQTGYALKYVSVIRQRDPTSAQMSATSSDLPGERGRAGEAVCREIGGAQPGHRAPPCAILDHRRMIDHAHDLAARPVIFRDADRFARLRLAEFQPACAQPGAAGRPPRAGTVVIAARRVLRDPRPRRDLVTQHERGEELARTYRAFRVHQRQQRRQDRHARVPFGQDVPVVAVQAVDIKPPASAAPGGLTRRPSNISRAPGPDPAPKCAPRDRGSGVTYRSLAARRRPDQIQQTALRLPDHAVRQGVVAQIVHKPVRRRVVISRRSRPWPAQNCGMIRLPSGYSSVYASAWPCDP